MEDARKTLIKKRIAVIVGLLALTAGLAAFCILYGPELLAFVADAPRFRAWVDETGPLSRVVFVLANMAQVVFAFLPGEPLELGAAAIAVLTLALAGIGVVAYRKLAFKSVVIENSYQ